MTLDEMINSGMSVDQITATVLNRVKVLEQEKKEKEAAEAADRAREEELKNARRQFKKAYAKYMAAITGKEIPESEVQAFADEVMTPIEETWNKLNKINNKRKITVKTNADAEELAEVIMAALKGIY